MVIWLLFAATGGVLAILSVLWMLPRLLSCLPCAHPRPRKPPSAAAQQAAEAPLGEQPRPHHHGQRSPWEDLPDAVFSSITQHAGLSTLRDARAVCSSWRAAAARTADALEPSALAPAALAASFPGLARLDLSRCCGPLAPEDLARAVARLPQLTELRLGSARRLGGAAGGLLAPPGAPPPPPPGPGGGPDAGPGAGDPGGDPDAPIGFSHVSDAGLSALAPLLHGGPSALAPGHLALRRLDLSGCVLVSDAGLLALTGLGALAELRLRRCGGVSDAGLVAAAQLEGLTRLDVAECPRITNLGLRALAPLALADLDASGCLLVEPFPSGAPPGDPGRLAGLAHLTTLRRLAAHGQGGGGGGGGAGELAPGALRPLSALSGLTSLSLGSAAPGARAAAAALAEEGGARRRGEAAAAGIAALAQWLPRLRALTLLAPKALAPGGDAALGALLPLEHLESLELCLSSLPTCDALAHMTALQHLALSIDVRHHRGPHHPPAGGPHLPAGAAAGAHDPPAAAAGGAHPPLGGGAAAPAASAGGGGAAPAGAGSSWDWGARPLPPKLRSLRMSVTGSCALQRASSTAWLGACGALTSLAASGCWLTAPGAPDHLLMLRRLEALDLTVPTDPFAGTSAAAVRTRDRLLAAAAQLPRLRALKLSVSIDMGTSGLASDRFLDHFSQLSALSALESLALGRSGLAGHALMRPAALGALPSLTALELHTGLHDRAGDEQLARLLAGLPRLARLRIVGPSAQAGADAGPRFTGAGLAPLAARAGGRGGGRSGGGGGGGGAAPLVSLTISRCFCFGAPGARLVARLATSLARLDLSSCTAVDDACAAHLADLTRLTSLNVSGCVRLGDPALSAFCGRLRRLAALAAADCPRVSDRGAARLPQLAASLLQLRLGPALGLTDVGLAGVGRLTCLTALQIAQCRHITDAGLPHLSGLRRLSALSLVGCGLSMEGILALAPLTGIAQIEF